MADALERHRDRRIARGLFLLTFVSYAYFFGGGGWNQNANFDLTRAIVEKGTFAIDAYRANTYDISFHDGRTYANKAPGVSLLAAIPYAPLYWIERAAGIDVDSFAAVTVNQWICTFSVCGTSGALLAVLLFGYARRTGASPRRALAIALIVAFGTYVFAYSTVLFAHVPAALLLFWSFVRTEKAASCAALAAGAVVCNYAVLPAAAIVVVVSLLHAPSLRRALALLLGGAPFVLLLMAFHTICFGGPFRTAVEATSGVFKTEGAALGVLVGPRLDVLFALLFSLRRGLLILSPVLVFAVVGAVVMIRERVRTRELATIAGVTIAFLLVNMSFNNWDGGGAIGPRYILPIVPFLAVPMIAGIDRSRLLFGVLAAISIVINVAVTAVNPIPSRRIADPIFGYTFPLLVTGRLPAGTPPHPPLAWKLSLGHVSVNRHAADEFVAFVKHPRGSRESEWASFNAGELLFPGSPLSLLPILVWMAGGATALFRYAERGAVSIPE